MNNPLRLGAALAGATFAVLALGACGARPAGSAGGDSVLSVSPAPSSQRLPTAHDENPGGAGDGAPHQAENNGWKQPKDLSAADQRLAQQAADRIRPQLEQLRATSDVSPDAVRRVLASLGYLENAIGVEPMSSPAGPGDAPVPPGAAFGIRVGSGCVTGSVRPEAVYLTVRGPIAEWGCMEPKTH